MKLINLPRQFVYTDRSTLDDFLRSDELNLLLYKVYLEVKDKPYYFKFPAEKAFNEAWYIATLAMNEAHPELDMKEWLWLSKYNMGWRYAADLVMSMAYVILYLQKDKPKMVEYVLPLFDNLNLGSEHFPAFKSMAQQETRQFSSDLAVHPCLVEEIEAKIPAVYSAFNPGAITWHKFTDDFEQMTVRELVSLFPTKDQQLKMIDLLKKRQYEEENPPQTPPNNLYLPF